MQGVWWRRLGVCLVSAVGVTVCIVLWRGISAGELALRLHALRSYWPWLLALELARAGCELAGTFALLGSDRGSIGWPALVRVQSVAFTLNTVMPAGRAASEAVKAALLVSRLGSARAFALGAATQALVLIVNAALAVFGAVLALRSRMPAGVAWALISYAGLTLTAASLMYAGARWPGLRTRVARWPALAASLERFAALGREQRAGLLGALLAQCGGRALQLAQLALLMHALGAPVTWASALLAQALYLVGGAAGDLVPAQLGAIDGAFALAASGLSLDHTAALALGLAVHVVQLGGALACALVAALCWLWHPRRPALATRSPT